MPINLRSYSLKGVLDLFSVRNTNDQQVKHIKRYNTEEDAANRPPMYKK